MLIKGIDNYKKLKKNSFLAELIGIVLGDGCITKFARTEALRVTCNSKEIEYANYVSELIGKVFGKKAAYTKRKNENAIDVRFYQKFISSRLELPSGNKIKNNIGVPEWIYGKDIYIVKCLKGIFDTDGHFRKNIENYLHVIELRNHCDKILEETFRMLKILGFNPQIGREYVRLAKKKEVYKFAKLINFRNNFAP